MIPLLLGAILKGYDDILDLSISIPSWCHILFMIAIIVLFIKMCRYHTELSISFLLLTLFLPGMDTLFWKVLPFLFVVCILESHHGKIQPFTIGFVCLIIMVAWIEHSFYPEENSHQKKWFRILLFLCLIGLLFIFNLFSLETPIIILTVFIGYVAVSIISKVF